LPSLIEVLRQIPDPRQKRGVRHPLPALLAVACAAMLCGYRTYGAIAEWGRNYDPAFLQALGFTRQHAPSAGTFFYVFGRLDRDRFEALLGGWAEQVLAATSPVAGEEAFAMDGKTLRGSKKQGAPGAHLLSVVSHRLGLTVAQRGVDEKTNEIPVAREVLAGLVLRGRIFTMDALLTQREIAQQIVAGGGDYVMLVKGNQPTLEQDIATVFASPPLLASGASTLAVTTRDTGASSAAS
jgi:hypothetical protein